MMLWIILTAMIVIAAVGLAILQVRRRDAGRGDNIALLEDQLSDLEARLAAGAIPAAEAEGLRTEIKSRILAEGPESEPPARSISERSLALLALGLIVIALFGATGLYLKLGRPGLASAPSNVAGQSPPAPIPAADVSPPSAGAPGEPSLDQMAAASQMPAGDRQVMIHKMVDDLAARLKANPRDPAGWLRLMRARMVLNQPEAAQAAYYDSLKAYADAPGQQQAFRDAAQELGIPGI
jgi:cytochrome c-type biogenesis protein CcmH